MQTPMDSTTINVEIEKINPEAEEASQGKIIVCRADLLLLVLVFVFVFLLLSFCLPFFIQLLIQNLSLSLGP
jgi:hypothetical protein